MKFRKWFETENSLNGSFPELFPPNRGSSAPASDMVRRTGLQPQVGSEEIHTDAKEEQDKIQAIDGAIQRLDSEVSSQNDKSDKIKKFKDLWMKLKDKWELLKSQEENNFEPVKTNGLGSATGNEKTLQFMQQNPNVTLNDPNI